MHKKKNKQKEVTLNLRALNREIERLFINNPFDLPSTGLERDDYRVLFKAAEIMTLYHDFPLNKDSHEWDYFRNKWNALHNFRCEEQLKEFATYHDVFTAVNKEWHNIKQSPYTYRCVASLLRMLDEE